MNDEGLWLGRRRDDGNATQLPPRALLRHVMALGSSGSGKTVLCKVVVEEAVRNGIPVICVDPQGDLCSLVEGAKDPQALAQHGIDPEVAREFAERADVVIFTPASPKGVPLSADPVDPGLGTLSPAERLQALTRTASMVTSLLGFDADSDEGAGLVAVLDGVLAEMLDAGREPSLAALGDTLLEHEKDGFARLSRYLDPKKIRTACQRLARLDVGARRLLFHEGVPIDVDVLLGRDSQSGGDGRIRVSVVYLNTLGSQDDKDFVVAALADRLYSWMLDHPSASPQALFYIDEVSPFIPPVRKPACKEGLALLFKQARKYGVCCLMATQNPGDVDYRAMSQFGTWALGRLTTRQDLKKIEPSIKSLDPVHSDALLAALPGLRPGQFTLLSPDHFDSAVPLEVRWLLSEHCTFDEERIEGVADERWRTRFAPLVGKRDPRAPSAPRASAQEPEPEVVAPQKSAQRTQPPVTEPTTRPGAPVAAERTAPLAAQPDATPPRGLESQDRDTPIPPTMDDPVTPPAPAAPHAPATPPAPNAREQAVTVAANRLAGKSSMTAKEFAVALGCSEKKARSMLKELVASGVAGQFKDGRVQRFWAYSTGARPDLGLPARVLAVAARIDANGAAAIAREHARSKLLGLIGSDEQLARVVLVYRLLYKVDFRETVERSVLHRMVGAGSEERLGSVYFHPHTLDVLSLSRDGVAFSPRPAERASAVADLDGNAAFAEATAAALPISEADYRARRSERDVARETKTRFAATPVSISNVFFPLWEITLQHDGGAGYRVVTIDALLGRPVTWPAPT